MWWWRKVRNHSYWRDAGGHPEGPSYFTQDVSLRQNEQGLSLYAAADQSEALKITHFFALTLGGYENLDYLLIPDSTWGAIGLRPKLIPNREIYPYLCDRHHEVHGLTRELGVQLVGIILQDTNRHAYRAKKRDIQEAARTYLQDDCSLHQFLHEEWRVRLTDR
jgi:hypothetical protein